MSRKDAADRGIDQKLSGRAGLPLFSRNWGDAVDWIVLQVSYRAIFLVSSGDDYTLEQRSAYLEFAALLHWSSKSSFGS